MLSWFKKKKVSEASSLTVDVHSHLLAGLDDGVQRQEDALSIIKTFQAMGYKKMITTPHVMSDGYKNTTEGIINKLNELRHFLKQENVEFEIEAAAEYYLDEVLLARVKNDEPLLTWGKNYLLCETNFISEPFNMKEFIFLASTKGYKLVLAHPERYIYLQGNMEKCQDLLDRGVLFQMNASSVTGYYSKPAQFTVQKLIDMEAIHFIGSDCHSIKHAEVFQSAQTMKYYQKALALPLLNNTL